MTLFPSGYAGAMVRLAILRTRADVRALDPEFRKRVFRLMRHLARAGVPLGIGGGGRTTAEQTALFVSRHYVDPAGSIEWNGKRWSRKAGQAPAAPPGKSYHETTAPYGALAVDTVPPASWDEQNLICHLFGLRHFASVNNEPWHLQPAELPTSRTTYNAQPSAYTLQTWRRPGSKRPGPQFPPYPKGGKK